MLLIQMLSPKRRLIADNVVKMMAADFMTEEAFADGTVTDTSAGNFWFQTKERMMLDEAIALLTNRGLATFAQQEHACGVCSQCLDIQTQNDPRQ